MSRKIYKYQVLKVVGPEQEVMLAKYKFFACQIGIGQGISMSRHCDDDGTVTVLFFDIYSIEELKFTELLRHFGRKIRAAVTGNKYFGRTIVIDAPFQ